MRNVRRRNILLIVLRDAAGLTQEAAARRKLLDRSTVSRCESGEIANDELLFELIQTYGGIPLIDRLIDILRRAREWYEMRERVGPLLYA